MYAKSLRREFQTRRFTIQLVPDAGWEVRDEANHEVVRRVVLRDWHRVEREIVTFAREADALRADGWVETSA